MSIKFKMNILMNLLQWFNSFIYVFSGHNGLVAVSTIFMTNLFS